MTVLLRFVLALATLSSAPPPGQTERFPPGRIVPAVACEGEPRQTYALYLPTSFSETRTWPVLYLYDPRKRGAVAVERFRDAAERYGWILAGSNNTMSDGPAAPNVVAMKAVWLDTHRRFRIDPRRIYAGGFSGAARAAVLLALETRGDVAGVIACGGGFPDESAPVKGMPFAFFGTVGNVDFNYGEMRRLDRTLAALGAAHRLAVFEGPHSWCPAPVCADGIEWLELQAIKTGRRAKDSALIQGLLRSRLERVAAAEAAGNRIEAFRRSSDVAEDFRGLADTKGAEGVAARLGQLDDVRREIAAEERGEEAERKSAERLWKDLNAALGSDPPLPLKAIANQLQIARLRKEAGAGRPEPARLSAARVLEQIFVQTAFYLPRDFAKKHDFLRAELATGIAAELKPDRAGAVFYDLACFRALAGDRKGALASLRHAVEKGFRDVTAMEADPDLALLREEKGYRAIVTELRARPTS
jgi:predicted esterase